MTPPLPLLRVLGAPALHGPDGEPIPFRTRKHFALLIYLALEPVSHRREKLAALLWPSATTSEARHSLSTGLSVLRARLGREAIETSRDTARLLPGSLEIDLDRLARGEIHATETTSALEIAPLLHDVVLGDALPWEQWRDALAAKWQPAIRDALLARIDRVRRQGNTRAMEILADTLISLDDLSEDGVRAKMESRAFAGDRLTALQIYEDWRVRLADELGAQPSDLVAGMALRLRRRGWERTSGEHIASVRTDQWKDRPFVGRAKEYESLYEGWEGCQRGTARHLLITGESGVGKSTLMERLTTAAGLQGAVSARVQCHEVEREIPYGAIGGLVTILLERPGATSVAPEWLGELSRTVSTVRRRFPNAPTPPEATGEMVRIRLADALHELVRAIAEEQPVILVMDDIHLADDASVSVMHLLLRRFTTERALVFCTLRPTEGPLAPSARGMMERADLAGMSIVPLPPLSEEECLELLGHLVPGEVGTPPATVRRALLRAANGLPMLIELLVRDWLSHGDRCVALAVQAMTEEPGTEGGAGETYRRLLERLTLGVDPTTRSVLNLAAVLGSQLNEFELYSLVDLTLAQAMSGLSQLAAIRIMRDSGHGLEFVNEVMRGEVYLAVPSSVRKVLHSKVADRLIERNEGGEEMLGLAIAWHCMRSGRVNEAGEWLVRGGEEAIAKSALAEAEEALESGYHNFPMPAKAACAALLVDVLIDQGRYQDASNIASGLSRFAPAQDRSQVGESVLMAGLALGTLASERQEEVMGSLICIINTTPSASTALRASTLAIGLASDTLNDKHLEHVAVAVTKASAKTAGMTRARFDLMAAQILFWQRNMAAAEATILAQLDATKRDGPALHDVSLQLGLATCLVARGDYEGAVPPTRRALALASRAGATGKELKATANLSLLLLRIGDYEGALQQAIQAQAFPHSEGTWMSGVAAYGVELTALSVLNRVTELQKALTRARALVASRPPTPITTSLRLWVADALWLSGSHSEALGEARAAIHLTSSNIQARYLGPTSRWAGRVFLEYADSSATDLISRALAAMSKSDALDQFEVATSALACSSFKPEWREVASTTMAEVGPRLPPATHKLLTRLGLRSAVEALP